MSTTITTIEVEEYAQAVRTALADLPAETVDELLEDLPAHLAEVSAELPAGGSLHDRLGPPQTYAADLRVAAGLAPIDDVVTSGPSRAEQFIGKMAASTDRLDVHLGRLLGYARAADAMRAIKPGWWIVRGWILAQLVAGVRGSGTWHGFVPRLSGSKLTGGLLLAVAVVASVWFGRRSRGFSVWPRRLILAGGGLLAVWAITVIPGAAAGETNFYDNSGFGPTNGYVDDVYVYDQSGNLVPNARLYDREGNPIQLGDGTCPDGSLAPGAQYDYNTGELLPSQTYPQCPSAPGPFRSGPGPVTAPTGVTPSGVAPSGATPTGMAPTATVSAPAPRPSSHKK